MGLLSRARDWRRRGSLAAGEPAKAPGERSSRTSGESTRSAQSARREREAALQPEMGWGGARIVGGIVSDEHNADLKGPKGMAAAAKMKRTDGQVRAIYRVVQLPIRSTIWLVEEPDTPSAAEKEAAELLRQNLFGGMEHSFDDLLAECTQAIYYGWRVPEIVWEERAGLLAIKKVAPRNPELVERWLYDPQGRLVGYLYVGNRPKGKGLTAEYGGADSFERVPVPIEKCIHLVYDRESDSPQGLGLWRSMYPHWYIKQAVYKILSIGIERSLLGVPFARAGEGANPEAKDAVLSILRRLRAAEDAAFYLPEGWEVEWFESQRDMMDAMPFVHHHNVMMAQAALAQMLNLGQDKAGTQALGEVHSKLFLDAEEADATWIEETLQQQLVKRWCRLNYGEGLRPPLLRHRRIGARSLEGLTQALQQLVSGNLMHPTVEDEVYLRDLAELPAIPPEQLRSMEQARQAEQERQSEPQPSSQEEAPGGEPREERASLRLSAQVLQQGDGESGSAERERAAREAQEAGFAAQAREQLRSVHRAYLRTLKPLVEAASSGEPDDRGQALARLSAVPVPGAGGYVEFLRGWLWQVYQEGRQSLAEETGQEPAEEPVSSRTRQWIAARAEAVAAHHLGLLRSETLNRVLTGIRGGLPAADILSDAEASGAERLQRLVASDWNAGAMELAEQAGRG